MDDRYSFSKARLTALSRQLEPVRDILDSNGLCVYATGSYGRLEAGPNSDIDLFFLHDAGRDVEFPYTQLVRVMARLIEATEDLGFPPFTGNGRVLSFYYRDFADHAEDFVPVFLLNDILRFWRTLTLNYEHHRLKILQLAGEEREQKKADSALKNYKLKVSRLTTCFSMAAHLGSSPVPVTPDEVLRLCELTPRERLAELAASNARAQEVVKQLEARYHAFLEVTQRPEGDAIAQFLDPDERRRALDEARGYGDLIFDLVTLVCPPERMRYFVV